MSPNLLSCLAVVLLASRPTTPSATVASCSVSATNDPGTHFRISEYCAHCAGISSSVEFTVSVEREGVIVESRIVDILASSGAQSYSPSNSFAEYHGRRGPSSADAHNRAYDWQLGDRLIFPDDYMWDSACVMTDSITRTAVAVWLSNKTTAEATYGHISTWDTSAVTDMQELFCASSTWCDYYNTAASSFNEDIGAWDTSGVTRMDYMFMSASAFNRDIGDWAVQSVTDMSWMFYSASAFDQDLGWCVDDDVDLDYAFDGTPCDVGNCGVVQKDEIDDCDVLKDGSIRTAVWRWLRNATAAEERYGHISTWDTSGVTDMSGLFCVRQDWMGDDDYYYPIPCDASAASFNDDIGAWDTSGVTSLEWMFVGQSAFNQPLNGWLVDKVTSTSGMFDAASSFDQPLGDWRVDSVKSMSGMFYDASAFNQPIGSWRVDNVTSIATMFLGASAFNQPIGDWQVDKVKRMVSMFNGASSFNQPLGDWRVDEVTDMFHMFNGASSFNQPIGAWRVDKVTTMYGMFEAASAFNQPLGDWRVDKVTTMFGMFRDASAFDQNLGWCVVDDVSLYDAFSGTQCEPTSCGVVRCSTKKKKRDKEQTPVAVVAGAAAAGALLLAVGAFCFYRRRKAPMMDKADEPSGSLPTSNPEPTEFPPPEEATAPKETEATAVAPEAEESPQETLAEEPPPQETHVKEPPPPPAKSWTFWRTEPEPEEAEPPLSPFSALRAERERELKTLASP